MAFNRFYNAKAKPGVFKRPRKAGPEYPVFERVPDSPGLWLAAEVVRDGARLVVDLGQEVPFVASAPKMGTKVVADVQGYAVFVEKVPFS